MQPPWYQLIYMYKESVDSILSYPIDIEKFHHDLHRYFPEIDGSNTNYQWNSENIKSLYDFIFYNNAATRNNYAHAECVIHNNQINTTCRFGAGGTSLVCNKAECIFYGPCMIRAGTININQLGLPESLVQIYRKVRYICSEMENFRQEFDIGEYEFKLYGYHSYRDPLDTKNKCYLSSETAFANIGEFLIIEFGKGDKRC